MKKIFTWLYEKLFGNKTQLVNTKEVFNIVDQKVEETVNEATTEQEVVVESEKSNWVGALTPEEVDALQKISSMNEVYKSAFDNNVEESVEEKSELVIEVKKPKKPRTKKTGSKKTKKQE